MSPFVMLPYSMPLVTLGHVLDNPTPAADDEFGFSSSISDSYAMVGAPRVDNGGSTLAGEAYIYNPDTGALLWTIPNPGGASNDSFSYKVGISDSYAIAGAPLASPGAVNSSGIAYIFDPSTGGLSHTLSNPSPGIGDSFGWSVGISESYAIVGARGDDGDANNGGRAYIFNPSTGALLWTLSSANPESDGNFGQDVAVSNSYAIVGAIESSGGLPNNNSGRAYIFNPATGGLLHTIDNPNAYGDGENDNFGWRVAISETYAIVGAYNESFPGQNGIAYIFDNATGNLLHTLEVGDSSSRFGWAVGITDEYAIVGAYNTIGGGRVHFFDCVSGALVQTVNNPNAFGSDFNDQFGYSVAISDSYAIAGAREEDDTGGGSKEGKAYIFDRLV